MKKQLLLSFLAGLVMPLVLAAAFQKSPPVLDVESDALSPTRAAEPEICQLKSAEYRDWMG